MQKLISCFPSVWRIESKGCVIVTRFSNKIEGLDGSDEVVQLFIIEAIFKLNIMNTLNISTKYQ